VATLTSTATLAQVRAAYDDNASYEEDGSVAKAKSFVTACRILLRRLPMSTGTGGGAYIQLSPTTIMEQLRAAQGWLASKADVEDGGSGIKHLSLEDYR